MVMTMVIILGGWITPDHPVMGELMDMSTNVDSAERDHNQRNRIDHVQHDWKICAHHFTGCECLSFVVRHQKLITTSS